MKQYSDIKTLARYCAAIFGLIILNLTYVFVALGILGAIGIVDCLLMILFSLLIGGIELVASTMDYHQKPKDNTTPTEK